MHKRFTKTMRMVLILNIIFTIIAFGIHCYYITRIQDTHNQITAKMDEMGVIRQTAIRMLEREGADLFFGRGLSAYFGVSISGLTLFLLYKYSKTNGFFYGFGAAYFGTMTTFVGGLILFFMLFTNRAEQDYELRNITFKSKWQQFIHRRSVHS